MLFSIIIPVYNVERYLRECLDSVLAQSYEDWEAVCVDDGSTDRSPEILAEYAEKDPRVIVLRQENGGLSAARNKGLDLARGEYILFLDSDDYLERQALQTLSDHLHGEDLLCFSGRRFHDDTGLFNEPDILADRTYPDGCQYYCENALTVRDFAFVCVVLRLYKKSYLEKAGLRFMEAISHEDNLFTPFACYHAGLVRVIPDCLYNYRVRSGSIMTSKKDNLSRDLMMIANTLAAFFSDRQDIDSPVVFRIITHHYQRAFLEAGPAEKNALKQLCDWSLYRKVSRTKPRHRLNYLKNRFL